MNLVADLIFMGSTWMRVCHCPRCGTARSSKKVGSEEASSEYVPLLVGRVIEFCGTLTEDNQDVIDNMERLGVTEAVRHPDVQ